MREFTLMIYFLVLLTLQLANVFADKASAEGYFGGIDATDKEGYMNWLDANFGTTYTQHSFLSTSSSSGGGAAVFWKIVGDEINFAVATHATGWLAFGISEAGGMLGSDVVYYETANPNEIVDSYILESRAAPLKDDCQNWNLISATVSDGWMILEVNRKLDTGDNQDHKIMDDAGGFVAPTRLIAAWGDTPSLSFHGTNAARNSVRLFANSSGISVKEAITTQLNDAAAGYFDVTASMYQIPAEDTKYKYECRTANDILQEIGVTDTPLTVIGAMPVITDETKASVHHFIVHSQPDCKGQTLDRSMIYAWAPGDEGWALPDNVGFPLFEAGNRQAISVEIHYNNPDLIAGQIDSSGVRFFYINGERSERAAMLELGDPTVSLYGEQINNGLTQYSFSCPGACSRGVLQQGGVTVLAEYLHMHQSGVRMTNEVIRNNEVVHTSKADVFEFDQQGALLVQQEPFEIKAGDAFRTSCYYRDGTQFGLSSQEEMCIAFVMYYPAKSALGFPWMCPYDLGVPICSQELEKFDVQDVLGLDRVFGTSGGKCPDTNDDDKPTVEEPGPGDGGASSSAGVGAKAKVFLTLVITSLAMLVDL